MFEQEESKLTKDTIKIKVIGVGGGGNNAVGQMLTSPIEGIEYYIVNTEKGIIDRSKNLGINAIQIGPTVTSGLGAGANPEIGESAAKESLSEIDKILDGADLVFLTAGMGGGTGTGAIPIIAEEAKSRGIITVAIVTVPFLFEGRLRRTKAENGIEKLKPYVNSLIVISNDRLLKNSDQNISIIDAFKLTDDVLKQAVESISDLINSVGDINIDFADIQTILGYEGYAYMGIGSSSSECKIEDATLDALSNPLTEAKLTNAKGVIFNICGSEDIGLEDINRSAEIISSKVDSDANIIFGTVIDPSLGDKVIVTVIATGVDKGPDIITDK
ncbi:MAG: cell division protein FtsZ [Clostridiales bacterium]|nr:cell division protein FtsZ [Clostridiales bacterium]MBB1553668.1 cell division protein FtsZ [Clostridiales bacterium]MBF0979296.1 cell division protein FtsZ [Clostridiales bacterium]MBF0985907.1 cell division protein FtsZ [Clostridiales bacterium]